MTKQPAPRKFVIVERKNLSGRYVALRGLAFDTEEAAKAHIVEKFNPRFRDRFSVETRAVEADDTSERMTCQCCGRKYLARTGTMAHHGYQRPGGGWQTASCSGAKELPFEKDHAALDALIVGLANTAKNLRKFAADTKAATVPVTASVTDYDVEMTSRWAPRPTLTVSFTAETFAAEVAKHPKSFQGHRGSTFADWQQKQVNRALGEAKGCEAYREECIKRRATWKHTHDYQRKAKEWVAI